MLTPGQTNQLLATLKAGGITFDELLIELLDHYSSATAGKIEMNENLSFEEALQEVHQEFGGDDGLKSIEKRYYRQMFRFYRNTQWHFFKQEFRLPHIIGTLFIALLLFLLCLILPNPDYLFYGLFLLASIPVIISLYHANKFSRRTIYNNRTVKGVMLVQVGSFGLTFLTILNLAPRFFLDNVLEQELMEKFLYSYPVIISIIFSAFLLHLLSFIKTLEHVKLKAA